MPRPVLETKVIGLTNVLESLRHLPPTVRPFFERAARFGQARMKRHARPQHPGPAKLAEGVNYDIKGEGGNAYALEAHVGFVGRGYGARSSLGALAPTVNYGRRPGKPPSVSAIRRWLVACGYHVDPWRTARYIGEHGTKGKFFLEKTADDLTAEIPNIMRQTEAEIETLWDRRGKAA